jgi:formyltetrahydrofolate deformylase
MKRLVATITVIGRDKTGVIARVTNFLFEQKANIEALEEQVTRGQFSMVLQASWAAGDFNIDRLRVGLSRLAKSLDMEITCRLQEPHRRQRMAVMVTRESHCLEALISRARPRQLKADAALIVANRRDLEPIARRRGIPFVCLNWEDRERAEREALRVLEAHEIDFIVLARFMKILSPNFVWRYKNKIINIHPSLLPSFPGAQAYRQAWEQGVKIVGVTAHFVTMHLDEGPIIAQGSLNVRSNMRLIDIIKAGRKLEAKILVRAVNLFLTKRLDVQWGVVKEI